MEENTELPSQGLPLGPCEPELEVAKSKNIAHCGG